MFDKLVRGLSKLCRTSATPRPLVSVIIASYNHASYVISAVGSVLQQHVKDIEIIVVDDGSTDGTPDFVERVDDPRVKLVRLHENRSRHPRNIGIQMARGAYIAFQNSDDVWKPGKLEAQLSVLEACPEALASFTGVELIGETGEPAGSNWASGLFSTENRSQSAWLRYFFDHGNCLCLPSAVIRREAVVRLGGFRGSLVQLSDLDLWVRLTAIGELRICEQPLTQMRILEDNFSRPSSGTRRRTAIEFADVLTRYVEHPVVEILPAVFKDLLWKQPDSRTSRVVALARYAWDLSPSHKLFADRVMAMILDNPKERCEAVKIYGTRLVHEFLKRRSDLEIHQY